MPTMSCPLRTIGQDCAWIGEGVLKFAVAARTSRGKPASAKAARGASACGERPAGAASSVMPSVSRRAATSAALRLETELAGE